MIAIAFIFLQPIWFSPPTTAHLANIDQIHIGMTKDAVESLLGQNWIECTGYTGAAANVCECYYYRDYKVWITFRSGCVIEVEENQRARRK